jgi:MoaA/NifB/PqqE/SkfB family radical SAM enzyme
LCETDLDIQLATVIHSGNVRTAHLIIEHFYPRIKRFHFLNVQRTAAALRHPDLLLDEELTLEFWLRLAEYVKRFPDDLFLPSLRVQLRAMGTARVDPEVSLHRQATFDCGVCSAGWTHVNITSDFDVLGCDIAKEHSFMGNCAEDTFAAVWRSKTADSVRNQSFPGCYKIVGPDGTRLADYLRPEFAVASSRNPPVTT